MTICTFSLIVSGITLYWTFKKEEILEDHIEEKGIPYESLESYLTIVIFILSFIMVSIYIVCNVLMVFYEKKYINYRYAVMSGVESNYEKLTE